MNNNQTKVVRVKNFFKEDISRYTIITTILISILLLGITIFNSVKGNGKQWMIWVSFVSAVFGMLNVTTYSIMDLKDPIKRKKYRIFILFNSIAVTTLAIINITTHLWILAVENLLFFFSGLYQFYNWFIKDQKHQNNNQNKNESSFSFKRLTSEDGFIFLAAALLAGLFISIISHSWTNDKLWTNYRGYLITRTIVDSILGVAGMLGAFMVGRKKFFSIWIYILGNTALITLWIILLVLSLTSGSEFKTYAKIAPVQCINMLGLFIFYNSANFLIFKKWHRNLEPKNKK